MTIRGLVDSVTGLHVDPTTTYAAIADGVTTEQADAIIANTAKVGITTEQADAITANTAKVGITTEQADAITANTAKVGITAEQTADIVALKGEIKTLTFDRGIGGVTDNIFNLLGSNIEIATGLTATYATPFSAMRNHVSINLTSLATAGTVIVKGTSISATSGIPEVTTETLILDAVGRYQTTKKWATVTEVELATGGFTYDISVLGYFDFADEDWTLCGYKADIRTTSDTSDFALTFSKVQDDGDSKCTIVPLEDYGHISILDGGTFFDGLRVSPHNREDILTATLAPNNGDLCYEMTDFESFFENDENVFEGSKNEGLIIRCEGRNASGSTGTISAIDTLTLTLYYRKHTGA